MHLQKSSGTECFKPVMMGWREYSHTTALVTMTHQLLIQSSLTVKPFTAAIIFFFFCSVAASAQDRHKQAN